MFDFKSGRCTGCQIFGEIGHYFAFLFTLLLLFCLGFEFLGLYFLYFLVYFTQIYDIQQLIPFPLLLSFLRFIWVRIMSLLHFSLLSLSHQLLLFETIPINKMPPKPLILMENIYFTPINIITINLKFSDIGISLTFRILSILQCSLIGCIGH